MFVRQRKAIYFSPSLFRTNTKKIISSSSLPPLLLLHLLPRLLSLSLSLLDHASPTVLPPSFCLLFCLSLSFHHALSLGLCSIGRLGDLWGRADWRHRMREQRWRGWGGRRDSRNSWDASLGAAGAVRVRVGVDVAPSLLVLLRRRKSKEAKNEYGEVSWRSVERGGFLAKNKIKYKPVKRLALSILSRINSCHAT